MDIVEVLERITGESGDQLGFPESQAAAKEIRRLRAAVTRWVPVSERLPELGNVVLVYIPFVRYCEARRNRTDWNLNGRAQFDGTEYWVWVDDAGCLDVLPTHWMPLPRPPSEETP